MAKNGIAAAGRPILHIGALDGEIAQLIEKHDCGITIRPGDVSGLVDAITRLAGYDALRARLDGNARKALVSYYEMRRALQKWRNLLDTVEKQ